MARFKAPNVVDMIFGKFDGRYTKKDVDDGNGKKPVIRPKGNMARVKTFPLALDKNKNFKWVDTPRGGRRLYLVPTKDIPGYTEKQYEDSVYSQLMSSVAEDNEHLRSKVEELEDRIRKLKSDKRQLSEEEEEQNKGGGGSVTRLRCSSCGEVSTESQWSGNGGICPVCQRGDVNNAERV